MTVITIIIFRVTFHLSHIPICCWSAAGGRSWQCIEDLISLYRDNILHLTRFRCWRRRVEPLQFPATWCELLFYLWKKKNRKKKERKNEKKANKTTKQNNNKQINPVLDRTVWWSWRSCPRQAYLNSYMTEACLKSTTSTAVWSEM